MSAAAELEELALPLPVPLDLRVIATPHALAMARDLAGLALPAGSTVQGVDVTLAEWHVGHRLELAIATPAGMCRAELERRQLTDSHPVTWELTYRRRAGSSDVDNYKGTPAELLEHLHANAEAIAIAQTPEPSPGPRRRKAKAKA